MADTVPEKLDKYDQWFKDFLGVSPQEMKAAVQARAATARISAAPADASPSPGAIGAPKKEGGAQFPDPQSNPFDAPEAQVAIEKLALPAVRELASSLALAAHQVFSNVLQGVKAKKKAEIDAEEAKREQMVTLVITIALMPAGPLEAAIASGIAGSSIRTRLTEVLANNAGALEAKFGARGAQVANKSFDALTGETLKTLAEKFDQEKAKKALESGVDTLKDKSVKFAASSNTGKCVESYLDAVGKSADDAITNLVKVILTTTSLSAAIAFYNMFEKPLHAAYEAILSQQVDDMLSEIAGPMAQRGHATTMAATDAAVTTGLDEIVSVMWNGRRRLATVSRIEVNGAFLSGKPSYGFQKWITPDMEGSAIKMVKENLTSEDFKGQHIPDPQCEPGERVVSVNVNGAKRLMLIQVEDKHGFFSTNYGVRTFKRWAEGREDEQVFQSRGAMQIGGIDEVKLSDIRELPTA